SASDRPALRCAGLCRYSEPALQWFAQRPSARLPPEVPPNCHRTVIPPTDDQLMSNLRANCTTIEGHIGRNLEGLDSTCDVAHISPLYAEGTPPHAPAFVRNKVTFPLQRDHGITRSPIHQ